VLEIIVPEETATSEAQGGQAGGMIVGPDGKIGVTYLGQIVAEGKTCEQLAAEIRQGLIEAKRYVSPSVLVRVREYGSKQVHVLGAVMKSGRITLRPKMTVREAVAEAEGVALEISPSPIAILVHEDGSAERFDLNEALRGEGPFGAKELKAGDSLVIEQSPPVTVFGCVQMPGIVKARGDEKLSEIIAATGGVLRVTTPSGQFPAGDLSRVTVNHTTGAVKQYNLLDSGADAPAEDPPIRGGDVVYVPRLDLEANVVGYVKSPSRHRLLGTERVSDLVAMAGGVLMGAADTGEQYPAGDLSQVQMIHADGTTVTLDVEAAMRGVGSPADNPLVLPGDMIVVPEHNLSVSILGHVVRPGRYLMQPGAKVTDAVARAGGPIRVAEVLSRLIAADPKHTLLLRASGESIEIDLSLLENDPANLKNLLLKPGDTIYIPAGRNQVQVAGYVVRPGYFEFREGDTVRTALSMAGGLDMGERPDDSAGDPHNVTVRHGDGKTEKIDVTVADVPLQQGDEITVPFARLRVAVLGFVVRPGFYRWHEGDTVVEMIAAAFGVDTKSGDRFHAAVIRGETDGEPQIIPLDLAKLYDHGDQSVNIPVLPDDIVYVPRSDHTNYGKWLTELRDAFMITNFIKALF
jgi:protein involved in polysaccharide export with SLBB domain